MTTTSSSFEAADFWRVMETVLPVIEISLDSYPSELIKRDFAEDGSVKLNWPFWSVVVPIVVFLTVTDAPAIGPLSSTTLPVTVLSCAHIKPGNNNSSSATSPLKVLFIRNCFVFTLSDQKLKETNL